MRNRGFTLIELIVVIIVVSILSVTILPRFANKADFEQAGFRDRTVAVLQYARKIAISSRRYICVTVGAGSINLKMVPTLPDDAVAPDCAQAHIPLLIPGSSDATLSAPSGVVLAVTAGSSPFTFDSLGQVSPTVTLSITGGAPIQITRAGYVY